MSRYERRQRALSRQISQLEEENVGKKDWVLSGEARAKDRPLNSLLEEDLEYEHTGKSTPTITTESVASLEERIKQRILGNDWDDVERRLPVDIAKMVPGRLMDVSAEPGKSLAEVFEAQHMAAIGQAEDLDEPTKKKHQEITELFDSICLKLDALSNARYTPKAVSFSSTPLACRTLFLTVFLATNLHSIYEQCLGCFYGRCSAHIHFGRHLACA